MPTEVRYKAYPSRHTLTGPHTWLVFDEYHNRAVARFKGGTAQEVEDLAKEYAQFKNYMTDRN